MEKVKNPKFAINDKVLVIHTGMVGIIKNWLYANPEFDIIYSVNLDGDDGLISFSEQDLMKNNPIPKIGTKNDSGKPRLSLIPKDAIWAIGRGLSYGEKKYGTHNFRNGLEYTRLADACLRHLTAWLECENVDEESGNSHLDHALASLAMLKFMEIHKPEMDDRWKPETK